jgi:hypothetical protein
LCVAALQVSLGELLAAELYEENDVLRAIADQEAAARRR